MGVSLVSNPPYNMAWRIPDLAGFMPQYMGWQIPPKSNANFAFILTALSCIDEKAVFLLPYGVLASNTKEELEIRKQLITNNLISAVITLPDSMFESTSIPVCVILFDKNKQTQKIEMIDMRQMFETENRDQRGQFGGNSHTGRTYHKTVNLITDDGMAKALNAIDALKNESGFCRAVTPDEISQNNYIITPSRYIEQEQAEEKHRLFSDIATDYNRIIAQKNAIKIKMNRTAAKRLGYDCMDVQRPDLTASFAVVGEKAEKEDFISFSADDGIRIAISTKDGIHPLIIDFLNHWKQMIMYLNTEENRLLAEFRDALIPELMSGKIKVKDDEED